MMSRAWFASAGWAFLCCVAGQVFITAASIAFFVLFFGALITAMFPPLLLLLGAGEGTGWHVVLFVVGVGLVVLGGSGWLMRWTYRRCRAVVFPHPPPKQVQWSWARRSSILVGIVASFVFVMIVPASLAGGMPSLPVAPADVPGTSGTV
jgi:hypothetical protein